MGSETVPLQFRHFRDLRVIDALICYLIYLEKVSDKV